MNAAVNYPTEREIQTIAYQALHDQLGSTGFIRLIQHYEQGAGDYTKGGHEILGNPSVDELFDAIDNSIN